MLAKLRLPPGRSRTLVALAVIAIGLVVVGFFAVRAVRSFRTLHYIREQGLDRGTASVDAIRPWMTIRFVAVAYAVPEEYMYSALGIPFDRRNRDQSLGELNRIYTLGNDPASNELVSVLKARDAVTAYRKNPVATGLRDVRPWMSVRYIANSTGVAMDRIFAAVSLPQAGNEDKPLEFLADERHYPGGPPALAKAIGDALAQLKATP